MRLNTQVLIATAVLLNSTFVNASAAKSAKSDDSIGVALQLGSNVSHCEGGRTLWSPKRFQEKVDGGDIIQPNSDLEKQLKNTCFQTITARIEESKDFDDIGRNLARGIGNGKIVYCRFEIKNNLGDLRVIHIQPTQNSRLNDRLLSLCISAAPYKVQEVVLGHGRSYSPTAVLVIFKTGNNKMSVSAREALGIGHQDPEWVEGKLPVKADGE